MYDRPLKQNAGPEQIARARHFRAEMPVAEQVLWRAVRNRKLDELKFRRQFPIENFTADFVCLEARLVVEVDGPSHESSAEADADRTEVIEASGFRVIRFSNEAVLYRLESVLREIVDVCASRRL